MADLGRPDGLGLRRCLCPRGTLLIEPLFNHYKPAPPGPVRDMVVAMGRQVGVPTDKIYIYNGSKQSNRYTANVSGLFGSARVAMSDTMFAQGADLAEVRGVVGHEMGHYVRKHILFMAPLTGLMVAIGGFLAQFLFVLIRRWTGADDIVGIADPAGLPILMIAVATLSLLSTPLMNSFTRMEEADADNFSLRHFNEPRRPGQGAGQDHRIPRGLAVETGGVHLLRPSQRSLAGAELHELEGQPPANGSCRPPACGLRRVSAFPLHGEAEAGHGQGRQLLTTKTEQLRWPSARADLVAAEAFQESGSVQGATEVLLVQRHTGDGFDGALQRREGELRAHEVEDDGPILQFAAQPAQTGRQDAPVIGDHRLAEAGRGVVRN